MTLLLLEFDGRELLFDFTGQAINRFAADASL